MFGMNTLHEGLNIREIFHYGNPNTTLSTGVTWEDIIPNISAWSIAHPHRKVHVHCFG